MVEKRISILGSGWLGLPLGEYLKSEGAFIKISTTSENKMALLKEKGFIPYIFSLEHFSDYEDIITDFLADSDIVIIAFPPKRRLPNIEQRYPTQVSSLISLIKPHQKVLFIGSTSVYGSSTEVISEETKAIPEKASGNAILTAEQIIFDSFNHNASVIRFAGLYGPDRHPGRFLANKKNLENGLAPINLIHLTDCISIISAIIEKNCWGEIFNGCSDLHPTKEEFYTLAAKTLGLTPPIFLAPSDISYKIISNTKSKRVLGIKYLYPNPMDFLLETHCS